VILLRAVTLGAILSLAVLATACSSEAAGQAATVRFHFSSFDPAIVTARAGEPVTITLRNEDPIEHEWIVGTPEVHDRHRTGTEPAHHEIPTEVTVAALSTRVTTVMFEQPGEYAFICHLPGHEAYGMRGILRVLPS
jgi:uncharacterized cupredoxin-like copper-binding protein